MGEAHGVVAFSSQLGLRAPSSGHQGFASAKGRPHLCESVVESSGLVFDGRTARVEIAAEVL